MKLVSLISLVMFPTILFSQGATCADMDPICTDVGASFTANTGTTAESGNDYGCLSTQPNPSWYYLEVATNGNIDMSLTAGSDIDFIIWGPYANLTAAKADCGSLGGNEIDCSYSATNTESPSIPNAVAGQVYIMLITNYANVVQDITLVQTGGAGSTDCSIVSNPPCFMSYFEATIGVCNSTSGTYEVTGSIDFDDPPSTGNLIVEDCDGNQTIVASAPFNVNAQGEGSETYTLTGLDPDGGPCSVTAFFSADPTCTQVLNYTAPECLCYFNFQQTYNVEPCDIATNTFDISGTLQFTNPPNTGFLEIFDCNGNSVQYPAPFTSPFDFVLADIPNIGTTDCELTARFTADPGCNVVFDGTESFDHPNCACPVDIGTFTTTVTGNSSNSIMQCFNDEITIIPNGDFIPHDDQGAGVGVAYDPAIAMAVFSCPPTVGPPNSINSDPCILGIVQDDMTGGWSETNVWGDNQTYWYVPISMYNYNTLTYAIDYSGFICYDLGNAWELTSLAPIQENTVEDCFAGTATTQIAGGTPSFNGSNFNVVPGSLTPATASFVNTSCANNGTITVTGLLDGDAYSYQVVDENDCPITISGVFSGMEDATFTYNFKYCQDEPDPTANITGVPGGDFTASPAGLVFLNTTTGLIDLSASTPGTYTIQYESPAATCWGTETFVLSINPLPLVNATEDSPICDDGVSTIQLDETGGEATSWSWSSNGSATITNPSDQNPVVSNDAVNGEVFTVTVTNLTTGCTNSDQVSVTVNPIEDASFTLTDFCEGATNSATITGTTGGTFAFNPAVTDGATINPSTGEISNGVGGTTYTVEYTTGGACPDASTQDVLVKPIPTVDPVTPIVVCNGDAISVTFTGSEAGANYAWTNSVTTIGLAANGNGDITSFNGINSGTTAVVSNLTVTPSLNGCTGTAENFTITVNPTEDASFTLTDFCEGATNSATITGTTGGTFAFNPAVTDGATINPSTGEFSNGVGGTTYTVEYTTGGACPDASTQNVLVKPIPTVDPVTPIVVCNGDAISVTFTGSEAGANYAWTNSVTTIGLAANGNGDITSFNGINSGTTAVVSNLTVTPSLNGCTGIAENFTITVNPTEDASFTLTDYCVGAANSATITGTTGGTFAFNPAVTDGATINPSTGEISNGVGGTTYTVEYTTAGACPDASTQDVLVKPVPTVDPVTPIEVCNGDAISVTFTGSEAGANYAWTNSVTTIGLAANGNGDIASFNGINSGTTAVVSNLTVTPSLNGCTGTAENFTITVNPTEDASFTLTDYCVGAANSANITGTTGGTFAFNPAVTDGATINSSTGEISNGVGGTTYTVEYTTGGACFDVSTQTVTVNPNPVPVITGALQYCQGTSTTLSTTSTYTDYLWSTGSVNQSTSATIADNPITVQVTDALGCVGTSTAVNVAENNAFVYNSQIEICQGESAEIHGNMETVAGVYSHTYNLPTGCDSTVNVTLVVNPLPNIDAGLDVTICNGESIVLEAMGGTSYTWDNGIGAGNSINVSPTSTTTYVVTGTDANNCSNTDDIIVTVNPLPTATISGTTSVCENDASPDITITGANGTAPYTFTYNINGGADITVNSVGNDAVIAVPTTPSGTFTYNLVSVEDASATNCAQAQNGSATITINANPSPSIIGDVDYCEGFTASISADQVYTTYDWSTGDNTQTIDVTTANNPITLTVTNAAGCSGTSAAYNIIENPTPIIDAGQDITICEGGSTTLTAQGAVDYSWDNGLGIGNNFNVSPMSNTIYTVTGTDANGCVGTDDVEVIVNAPPTATISGTTSICENDPSPTVTFTGADGTAPYTFTYNINGGPDLTVVSNGNTADVVAPNTPSGVYTFNLISVEESSANNCSQNQSGSAVITVNALPNIEAGTDQVACGNDQITLSATGGVNYVWDNGVQDGVPFTPVTGVYTVIGVDANGCVNTDNVSVLVSPTPVPDFTVDYTSCEPFIATLTNTTPGVSSNCVWQISNTAPIQGCGPIVMTFNSPGQYDVTLTTSNQDGCTASTTVTNAFSFEESPVAEFSPYNTVISTLDTEVNFENNSTGASSYSWDFGDNSPTSSDTNPVHQYDQDETGNYVVTLIAYSDAGCSDTAYGYIRIEEEIIYYVPNTFTPDNDVYNQIFQPVFTAGYDPFDYTLIIFDRWGEIVFESHDVTVGWDGTYAGTYDVQDGTYTWKIEFKTTINDKRISKVGHVNVLR